MRKIQIFKAKLAPSTTTAAPIVQAAAQGTVFSPHEAITPPRRYQQRLMTPAEFRPEGLMTPADFRSDLTASTPQDSSSEFTYPPSQPELASSSRKEESTVRQLETFQQGVLKQFNYHQGKLAEPVLRILDELLDNILQVDLTSLSISVHGKSIPSSHLVNIIKRMQNTLSGSPIPPGYQNVLEVLANKQTWQAA